MRGTVEEPYFNLGGFAIRIHGYEFPNATDYWDGNWLDVSCACTAPGATVTVRGPFVRINEIFDLLESLEALLSGAEVPDVKFMEQELALDFESSGLGELRFTVSLTPNLNQSHQMSFDIDQSHLTAAIEQCKAILANYPLKDGITE